MRATNRKFSDTYNHHSIFEDPTSDAIIEQRENILNISLRQRTPSKNRTFSSTVFNVQYEKNSENVAPLFDRKSRSPSNDLPASAIFGVHEIAAGISTQNKKKQVESVARSISQPSCQRREPLTSFNGCWWQTSAIPNNRDSNEADQKTTPWEFARDRKLNSLNSSIGFDNNVRRQSVRSVSVTEERNDVKDKGDFKEISFGANLPNKRVHFDGDSQEKVVLQERPESASSSLCSRNINQNDGDANNKKTAVITEEVEEEFQCKEETTKNEKNASQRHFRNLSSVLDKHELTAEFKNGSSISDKVKRDRYVPINHPPQKVLPTILKVEEDIELVEIEIKSLGKRFEQESFRRFCSMKGYTIVALKRNPNARAILYLKFASKYADPVAAITVNLISYGAAISGIHVMKGKDFNSKRFDETTQVLKPIPPPKPQKGRKHFHPQVEDSLDKLKLLSIYSNKLDDQTQ